MMTVNEMASLRRAYAKRVEDWELLLVMADAHLDGGDESGAACLRWMSTHHRRPYRIDGDWYWGRGGRPLSPVILSQLPEELYLAAGQAFRGSPSALAALDTILAAWKVVPQA